MVSRILFRAVPPPGFSVRSVTHDDLRMTRRGPSGGAPLLLLHGWGSSAQQMQPLADALSDRYDTHTPDLPGHGGSPPPPTAWGVPEHADLLHAYIREEIREPVTLIGHSNGGRIGLYMASEPSMQANVSRLVLVSPSGIEPERSWSFYARAGVARALKAPLQMLPPPVRAPALDWLRHSAVWRLLGSSDYNAASGTMRETFVKTVSHHLDDRVSRIDVPVLVFWGTEDEAISRQQMDVLEAAIDDCGIVELDGAGHYGHLDAFPTVLSATRSFLDAPPPSGRSPSD
jgi:pimeloyl-ACP methyl ester carboxylesterase